MANRPWHRLRWMPIVVVTACVPDPVTSPQQDALLVTAAACMTPPTGLVSWWPGEGDAADIAGSNEGVLQGGMGFGAGTVGQAFLLDGIDDYVAAGNDPSLHVSSGDFTVEGWVLFNDLDHPPGGNLNNAPQGDMSIVDKMRLGNQDGWRLLKQSDNRFWFCLGNGVNGCGGAGSPTTVVSTTVVTTGVWYHVAAIKSAAGLAIYVNGVQQHAKALPSFVDTHAGNLRIGSHVNDGAHLNGLIDEVDIFNRALSAAEVAGIYAAGSDGKCQGSSPPPPPPPAPTLTSCPVAEYRFNETGTTAPSGGSDPTVLLLKDRNGNATDLHGAPGTGVSGLSGDRAFDNRASDWAGFGGVGVQPGDNEALDRFSSFTVQGWFKGDDGVSVTGNLARLVEKTDGFAGGGGWGVDWAPQQPFGRATGSIGVGIKGEGGIGGAVSPASYLSQNQWIFFAVTYDGTASSNNVKFYRGTVTQSLQLVATGTVAVGTERGSVTPMSVGNGANLVRAFKGSLDNIRIFGVKSGNAGMLAVTDLEAIRAADASNTVTDTDGDGLTDSCDPDDDGDGYSDVDEIAAGSNPLNAGSTPERCDGVDNDLDSQIDDGFTNTDGDAQADCVDPDDDNDGLYDSVDDDDLVPSNHFTRGATSGALTRVPLNVKVILEPHNWLNTVQAIVTTTGPVPVREILRINFDGKEHAFEMQNIQLCIDWATLMLGRPSCDFAFRDPPAQLDAYASAVQGSAEMVSVLNGQRFAIGIALGSTARITEITNAPGDLTDVIVSATGAMSGTDGVFNPPADPTGVTVAGNPLPVGTATAIGRLQAIVKLSNGKQRSASISGTFTPSAISDGLNPLTEEVAIRVGPYSWVIAAGSFQRASDGAYLYTGTLGGVTVSVQTKPAKGGVWSFQVNAIPVNNLTTPAPVWFRIGNDAASATSG